MTTEQRKKRRRRQEVLNRQEGIALSTTRGRRTSHQMAVGVTGMTHTQTSKDHLFVAVTMKRASPIAETGLKDVKFVADL